MAGIFWCKSLEFGRGSCNGARKVTWGLCPACYITKVERYPATVQDYEDWWGNNMDVLNCQD